MNPTVSSEPATVAGPVGRETATSEIDASCRLPLLVLFLSGAVWLVITSALALISSIKFHSPDFLAGPPWLTYGRVHPAATSAFLYGFCLQSGFGMSLWLLARLGRTRLRQPWLVTVGAKLWNLGVIVGLGGILAGDRTGFEAMDLPGYATPLVFLGCVLIGISTALTFHQRREPRLYVSQWFLFAALFWFPWIYSTAQLLLVTFPVRGVAQSAIAWWYANNVRVVWLWLVGLAAVFYLLPKLARRQFQNRNLALCAFWFILLFGSWGGIPNSAPVPAWMPALSTVGTGLTIVALLAVGLSVWKTVRGKIRPEAAAGGASGSLPLRFVLFGVLAYLLAGCGRILGSVPPIGNVTDMTWFGPAIDQLNTYGFFAMVSFGVAYWIMPHLTGLEFPWPRLARAHFWLAALGIVLLAVPLAIAGVLEGLKLRSPDNAFMEVVKATLPCLRASTMGDLLIALGHIAFLANLAGLAAAFYRAPAGSAFHSLTLDLYKPAGVKP